MCSKIVCGLYYYYYLSVTKKRQENAFYFIWKPTLCQRHGFIWAGSCFWWVGYILIRAPVLPNNDSCSSDSNFFPSFLPSHPGAPRSLSCFVVLKYACLSGMPVTGPNFVCPNLPHDEMILLKRVQYVSIFTPLPTPKASVLRTPPRNILIKAHRVLFVTLAGRSRWNKSKLWQRWMDEDLRGDEK